MQRNASDFLNLGNEALESKRYTEAVTFFSQALEENPELTEACFKRGIAFFKLRMINDALLDYQRIYYLQTYKSSPEYYYQFIQAYHAEWLQLRKIKDYQNANKISDDRTGLINHYLKFEPKTVQDVLRYNKLCRDQDRKKFDYFDYALQLDPNNVAIFNQRGKAYRRLSKNAEAIADYSHALKLDPSNNKARVNRGKIYREQGQLSKAIDDFTKVLESNPTKKHALIALKNRGKVYEKQNKLPEAIADFTRALKLEPNVPLIYFQRGELHEQLKEISNAIVDYTTAIQIITKSDDKDNIISYLYRKRGMLYEAQGSLGDAIFDYSQSVRGIFGSPSSDKLPTLLAKHSKDAVFHAIKYLTLEKRIPLLLDCRGKGYLAEKMWEQRWWTAPELGKGFLKKVSDELDAVVNLVTPNGCSYLHMVALGQDEKTFSTLHGVVFSHHRERPDYMVNNFKELIGNLSSKALHQAVFKDPSVLDTVLEHHPAEVFHELIEKLDDESVMFLLSRPNVPSKTIIKLCENMVNDPDHWRTAKIKSVLSRGFSLLEEIKKIIATDPTNIAMHILLAKAYERPLEWYVDSATAINSYMNALQLLLNADLPTNTLVDNINIFETSIMNNLLRLLYEQLAKAKDAQNVSEEARINVLLNVTIEIATNKEGSNPNLFAAIKPILEYDCYEAKVLKAYAQDMIRLKEYKQNIKTNLLQLKHEIETNYYHLNSHMIKSGEKGVALKTVAPEIVKIIYYYLTMLTQSELSAYGAYKKCVHELLKFELGDESNAIFKTKALATLIYKPAASPELTEEAPAVSVPEIAVAKPELSVEEPLTVPEIPIAKPELSAEAPLNVPEIPSAKPESEESLAEVMQQIRVLANKDPADREEKYLKLGTPDEVPMAEPEPEPSLAELMRQIRVLVNKEPVASAIQEKQAKIDPTPAIQPERLKLDAKNMQRPDTKVTNKSYRGDDLIAMAPSVPVEDPTAVPFEKSSAVAHRDRLFAGQEQSESKSKPAKSKTPLKPTT